MTKKITKPQTKLYNLVLGLSGPYGAGCTSLAEDLKKAIDDWPGCIAKTIHVASLIETYYRTIFNKQLDTENINKAKRRETLQKAGTDLRKKDYELIGKIISSNIHEIGVELEKQGKLNEVGTIVFIVDSLKNSNEVELLRRSYLDEFYLIFIHADREIRWRRMVDYKSWEDKDRVKFEQRDQIDQDEKSIKPPVKDAGQEVGKISGMADYYIVNDKNREKLQEDGERFIELLYGDSQNQPTLDERTMHLAYSASNRSFCLSRQVGAVVVDNNWNVLGIGHNDVPKAQGGLYNQEENNDWRCYLVGDRRCISETNKEERFQNLSEEIIKELNKKLDLDKQLGNKVKNVIKKSPFKEATEFCRAVHAEMEALLSVSRAGNASTAGAMMYVTTEPCHNCLKHIICAGISKVIFMEPYPKSLGLELHSDAILIGAGSLEYSEEKVLFIPYQGVAPHRFHHFFSLVSERKDNTGRYMHRSKEDQAKNPRFANLLFPRSRTTEPHDPITSFEASHLIYLTKLITKSNNN